MQFDFAGTLGVPDGRYLADKDDAERQRVLVVKCVGAPAPPRRRRRRPRQAAPGQEPSTLPLTRVTAVRAQEPFETAEAAAAWLAQTISGEEATDAVFADAVDLLNRALHVQAVASADPLGGAFGPERAAAVRIGYGSGGEVAAGRFSAAHEVDARGGGSRRRQRDEELHPQARLAAVLGGREQLDACETLLLRARADLDAGRTREAALQLRVGLEALLAELAGALPDPDHAEDMAELEARRQEAGEAANAALRGKLGIEQERQVEELLAICERVLRRRRILRG